MALLERTVIDMVEVLRTGDIQVRESIEIYDNQTNEIKSQKFHRFIINSDDDTPVDIQAFMDNSKKITKYNNRTIEAKKVPSKKTKVLATNEKKVTKRKPVGAKTINAKSKRVKTNPIVISANKKKPKEK